MDGVCIKIGLIFPVALQEAIKNLKLRFCCWVDGWLALSSRVALTRERERELEREKKRTAFEKFSSNGHSSLSGSLSPSHYQKGAGRPPRRRHCRRWRLPREIRSFKRGAKVVALNGELGNT